MSERLMEEVRHVEGGPSNEYVIALRGIETKGRVQKEPVKAYPLVGFGAARRQRRHPSINRERVIVFIFAFGVGVVFP